MTAMLWVILASEVFHIGAAGSGGGERFSRGDGNGCLGAAVPITSAGRCELAAEKFGVAWAGQSSGGLLPAGCILAKEAGVDGAMIFNVGNATTELLNGEVVYACEGCVDEISTKFEHVFSMFFHLECLRQLPPTNIVMCHYDSTAAYAEALLGELQLQSCLWAVGGLCSYASLMLTGGVPARQKNDPKEVGKKKLYLIYSANVVWNLIQLLQALTLLLSVAVWVTSYQTMMFHYHKCMTLWEGTSVAILDILAALLGFAHPAVACRLALASLQLTVVKTAAEFQDAESKWSSCARKMEGAVHLCYVVGLSSSLLVSTFVWTLGGVLLIPFLPFLLVLLLGYAMWEIAVDFSLRKTPKRWSEELAGAVQWRIGAVDMWSGIKRAVAEPRLWLRGLRGRDLRQALSMQELTYFTIMSVSLAPVLTSGATLAAHLYGSGIEGPTGTLYSYMFGSFSIGIRLPDLLALWELDWKIKPLDVAKALAQKFEDLAPELLIADARALVFLASSLGVIRNTLQFLNWLSGKISSSVQLPTNQIMSDKIIGDKLRSDGKLLKGMPEHIRAKRTHVLIAVESDGAAMEFASEKLKGDVDFVKEAIVLDPRAFDFVSDVAQQDPEVLELHRRTRSARALQELQRASEQGIDELLPTLASIAAEGHVATEDLKPFCERLVSQAKQGGVKKVRHTLEEAETVLSVEQKQELQNFLDTAEAEEKRAKLEDRRAMQTEAETRRAKAERDTSGEEKRKA